MRQLKIQCPKGHVGSIPTSGTIDIKGLSVFAEVFLFAEDRGKGVRRPAVVGEAGIPWRLAGGAPRPFQSPQLTGHMPSVPCCKPKRVCYDGADG